MIVRTRGGGNRESRMPSQFAQDYIPPPGQFGAYIGSVNGALGMVHPDRAAGIPAVLNAIWLIAEVMASVPLKIWSGHDAGKKVEDGSLQWRLLHDRPNDEQSPFDFWFDIAAGIESRGNAFVQKVKVAGQVLALYVIDPDIVEVTRRRTDNRKVFAISGQDGRVELTSADVLHFRGPTMKGGDVGMTPLKMAAHLMSSSLHASQHEASMYQHGGAVPYAVTFPNDKNDQQIRSIARLWKETHAGRNSGTPAFLSGGADIKQLGITLEDAQFVESRRLAVEDIARIFRLPRSVLNAEDQGDIEQETLRLLTFGLRPRFDRLRAALNADLDLFPEGSPLYPQFYTDEIIALDAATKDQIYHQKVQDGRILVDEARAEDGRPPLPDGAGQVPQITPVGGAPNAAAVAANSNGNGAAA